MQRRWLGFIAVWIACVGIAMHFSRNIFPDHTILIWILSLSAAILGTATSFGFSLYKVQEARFKEEYAELEGSDEAVKVSALTSPTKKQRVIIIILFFIFCVSKPTLILPISSIRNDTYRIVSLGTGRPEQYIASKAWLATCSFAVFYGSASL